MILLYDGLMCSESLMNVDKKLPRCAPYISAKNSRAWACICVWSLCSFLAFPALSAQPGSLDSNFDPAAGVDQSVFAIAVQSDGRIIIGGDFNTVNGIPHKGVARLGTNGVVDPNFSAGAGPDDV